MPKNIIKRLLKRNFLWVLMKFRYNMMGDFMKKPRKDSYQEAEINLLKEIFEECRRNDP